MANKNAKGEIKMENTVKLNGNIFEDYKEAQEILDKSDKLGHLLIDDVYNNRVEFDGLGTYKTVVDSRIKYDEFYRKMSDEKWEKRSEIIDLYSEKIQELRKSIDVMDYDDFAIARQGILNERDNSVNTDKMCNFPFISFKNWKENRMESGTKLAKGMRKAGFSQELIDFYSLQSKDATKEVYVTITDVPQAIVGMTYYNNGSWNSCQNVTSTYEEQKHLAGSLADEKLFIAFMHDDMDCIKNGNLRNSFAARTIMRYVMVDDKPCLVATKYYGINDSVQAMQQAILNISKVADVYPQYVDGFGSESITENVDNSYFDFTNLKTVEWNIFEDYDVEIDCPVCDSGHEIEIECNQGLSHYVNCPVCEGSGVIEHTIEVDEEGEIEIEQEEEIGTYVEEYSYNMYLGCMCIDVCTDYVRDRREIRLMEEMEKEEVAL